MCSEREYSAGEGIDYEGILLKLHAVSARRLASLRRTHLCQMEVGAEVLDAFRGEYSYAETLFSKQQPNGKGHINLNLANTRQMTDAGLSAERIYDCGLCTWLQNDLFF